MLLALNVLLLTALAGRGPLQRQVTLHRYNREIASAERQVSLADLSRLQDWVKSEPHAPEGDWYKDFGSFKLCGPAQSKLEVLCFEEVVEPPAGIEPATC